MGDRFATQGEAEQALAKLAKRYLKGEVSEGEYEAACWATEQQGKRAKRKPREGSRK